MDREPDMLDEAETIQIDEFAREPRLPAAKRPMSKRIKVGASWLALADGAEQLQALRDGAAGVVPGAAGERELAAAVELIRHGQSVLPAGLLRELLPAAGPFAAGPSLTPREASVLTLLSEGATNKMIARRLDISVHTAKFHVASILDKLDATTRTDAVAQGVRQGLLML